MTILNFLIGVPSALYKRLNVRSRGKETRVKGRGKRTDDGVKLSLERLSSLASGQQQLLLGQIPLFDQLERDLSGSLKLSGQIGDLNLGDCIERRSS